VSDAKRLKALEDENAKLKRLLAEAELDKAIQAKHASQIEITEVLAFRKT
jgi:putative transposase